MTGDFLFFSVSSVSLVVQAFWIVALDSRLRGNDGDGGVRDLDKLPVLGAIRFDSAGKEAVETEPG